MRIYEFVADTLQNLGPFEQNPHIAVAVSGGADSLALVLLTNEWVQSNGGSLTAITIDHDLRIDSKSEAEFVHAKLTTLGIAHHIIKWEHPNLKGNLQQEARNARYKLLTDFCNQQAILHLLIAHHKNDQIETFFLRLFRGSGLSGLTAMDKISHLNGVRILRPLLDLDKEELVSYLQSQNENWVEDPSNNNAKFDRIKVRNFINNQDFLEKSLFNNRIILAINNLKRAKETFNCNLNNKIVGVVEISNLGYAKINIKKFLCLYEEEALKILARLLDMVGGNCYSPRFKSLQNVYYNIVANKTTQNLANAVLTIEDGYLLIYKEIGKKNRKCLIDKTDTYWDNRFKVVFSDHQLRYLQENDAYIDDLGRQNAKIVLSSDEKLDIIATLPAIYVGSELIAVPSLNYYCDHFKELISIYFKPLITLT